MTNLNKDEMLGTVKTDAIMFLSTSLIRTYQRLQNLLATQDSTRISLEISH